MIIWINGPFGAGKTTLAHKLRERRPGLLLFDPEEIGFVVRATVPGATGVNYQDLPVWRGLTVAALSELRKHYQQDIVVPMTLVRLDHMEEILGGARSIDENLIHIFLKLDERTLRDRIERQQMHPDPVRNDEIRRWRLAQVDRCMAAADRLPDDTWFLDSGLYGPEELAALVIGAMGRDRARQQVPGKPARA